MGSSTKLLLLMLLLLLLMLLLLLWAQEGKTWRLAHLLTRRRSPTRECLDLEVEVPAMLALLEVMPHQGKA